jgi:hypothetical protein
MSNQIWLSSAELWANFGPYSDDECVKNIVWPVEPDGKEFPGGELADVNRSNPERQEAREVREGGADLAPTGARMPPGKTSGPVGGIGAK